MPREVTIPHTVFVEITRTLAQLKQAIVIDDLITKEEACVLLNWSPKYFTNRQVPYDSINEMGVKFYSRQRLKGLKKQTA